MMKKLLTILMLTVSVGLFAQKDFQGKAYYFSKTTFDMDFGGRQMSPEMKKRIAENMKKMLEKDFVLTFDKTASIYKEEEQLDAPGQGGMRFMRMGGMSSGTMYANIKDKQLIEDKEMFGKAFLIKDELPQLDWKLEDETKQIGQYMCFKATAIKKVDELDFRSMRRKKKKEDGEKKEDDKKEASEKVKDSTRAKTKGFMDNFEMPKEITVTAWYTPQIPVSQGPEGYNGLPGLILELHADKTTILCKKVVMNPKEKTEIKAPSKGKEVTKKEYNEIMKKKMEEMRNMYRGRRGGRGRSVRIGR